MTAPITTIVRLALVAVLALALVGCGGGENDADNGASGVDGADSAAYRHVDEFLTHMANSEYASAQELVDTGGSADILADYVDAKDRSMENPNAAMIWDVFFERITDRFGEASITGVELDGDSAEVSVALGEDTFTLGVNSLDGGETWLIDLPQGFLVPAEDLIRDALPDVQERMEQQGQEQEQGEG